MSDSILLQITTQFNSVTADDWKEKINKDLKGASFEKLISHTEDEIEILPFYTAETTKDFQLLIPAKQTENWFVTEKIIVHDFIAANKNSLQALQNGANCILFDLQNLPITKSEIHQLIQGILLDIVSVFFYNYKEENKKDLEICVPNSCILSIKIEQQKSTVNELVDAFNDGVFQNSNPIYFHFHIGQNYFLEITKLRAFRWLWQQFASVNDLTNPIFIIAETGNSKRDDNENSKEIYTNILRNTTEAMSAIIGGCDYLIVNSHDVEMENSDFGKRIARNVQHILYNESYFNNFKDIGKASYYVEYLTFQLAKKTWNRLQVK